MATGLGFSDVKRKNSLLYDWELKTNRMKRLAFLVVQETRKCGII
jgi:hypothetical protein